MYIMKCSTQLFNLVLNYASLSLSLSLSLSPFSLFDFSGASLLLLHVPPLPAQATMTTMLVTITEEEEEVVVVDHHHHHPQVRLLCRATPSVERSCAVHR